MSDDTTEQKKGPSQATKLIELADSLVDVVAGTDGRAYAVPRGGAIASPLRGAQGLRVQLAHHYAESYGAVPGQSALTDAITVLEGRALGQQPREVNLRLASHGQAVVLDLATTTGACVIATPHGWEIAQTSPVLFRRTRLTSPLPTPQSEGITTGLNALRGLLNVDEPTFRMIVGWLVAGLIPDMPHPILCGKGEQGTGKSTALAMLVGLIDPSPAPLRSLPRDIKTWATLANASWAVCLDNVSTIPAWLSDTLCKAVTGDGIVDRALYTDDDVSVLSFRRLLAMTSIDTGSLASDLTERLLIAEFQPIKGEQRHTDAALHEAYRQHAPTILGALLDVACAVLHQLPQTQLDELPRMADFARLLAALDTVTGWESLATYRAATEVNTADLLDAKPFTSAVADLIEGRDRWEGTIGQLLEEIEVPDPRPKSWPSDPTRAAGQLKRDAPVLRSIGISVEAAGRSSGRHRSRLYRLTLDADTADTGETGSGPVSAPVSDHYPSSEPGADTVDAADTDMPALSTVAPVASGTCQSCGSTYRRYATDTGFGSHCAICALGGDPPATT